MKKQSKSLFFIPLIALTLAFSSSPPMTASADESLIGTWQGAAFVKESPIGVDLEITQVKVNTNGGVFHYGEPRACRLNVAYITTNNGVYWFAMKESTGGYCDKLDGKNITFKPDPDQKQLTYEIAASQSGGETESATLQKSE